MAKKKSNYYAYLVPKGPSGIADSWAKCEKFVKGKPGARFMGFATRAEAEAWLAQGAQYEAKPAKARVAAAALEPGIYFDAGTGRGNGVEVSVTDERGNNLLHKAVPKTQLNKFGKHLVSAREATNNYGELLALRYALEIAKKEGVKKVFGDSRLVIDYWSQWRMKRNELPAETVTLATEVAKLREAFEERGGTVKRISGDYNPADLGFHR